MAISENRRQKKLAKKKKKRKLSARSERAAPAMTVASNYSQFPVHECLVPDALFDCGLGPVIWARRTPDGMIASSVFLVDVYCLGVKDAFVQVCSQLEYEHRLKPRFTDLLGFQEFEILAPECARKLIEGVVQYADELEFSPHADYQNAKGIFGDVDPDVCPTSFAFGHNGKPLYIRGPGESIAQAERIIDRLERLCGPGNFDYLLSS
ncbi:hypothetical protein LRB11_14085 [Ectothiorhodospira haloalkaliphila]|uniref:hypothetical protein n=1 Tax=Ectothiorhodospira haloalkaliphila TaxID=421628 RepID=UPI001EE9811A|nr:hypothetical protein [Ectothiorhodospira haloalkaliphila]MCG5526050.1 hypothetical protein [Ectothiorhodospira haloalkaliphila]